MKKLSAAEKNRFEILLTKAVDGELDNAEQAEFEALLASHPQCRKEWQEHTKIKEVTKMMKFKQPSAEVWDSYWVNIYNRIERGLAWIAISVGAVILLTYAIYHLIEALFGLMSDPVVPFLIKLAVILVIGGLVVLFVSVVREKLMLQKKDQYKEVKR
ncbi:MAG: anti-sigma factor family protein [bacterium]